MGKTFTRNLFFIFLLCISNSRLTAQLKWVPADTYNNGLPASVKVYYTADSLEGKPNMAFYLEADLNDPNLIFTTDTTYKRRLTPQQFYTKNNRPLAVVNGTFFSFETNQNLNVVVGNGMPHAYNIRSVRGRGRDSIHQLRIYRGAIGITKNRKADVAWVYTDTSHYVVRASQTPVRPHIMVRTDTLHEKNKLRRYRKEEKRRKFKTFKPWKVETAIGGGPVLLQNGEIKITNEEEMMFTGRAINDRHPRTAMGYTAGGKLIILVIQGRFPTQAEGATLKQEAQLLKDLGCVEALNLDGGGSSCLLVNGRETIRPSDKGGQRAVPAVFMILQK